MDVLWGFARCVAFAFDAVCMLVGSGSVLLAIYLLFTALVKLLTWRRAVGTVAGFEEEAGGFFPSVTYSLPSGERVTATATSGRGVRGHRVGDSVRVLVDPRNPKRIELLTVMNICFPVIVIGAIAAAFVFVTAHNWQRLFVYP